MAEGEWWEGFFTGLWVDLQLQAWDEATTRAQVDFLERALELRSGMRVLDAPCGEGRHSRELASRGYSVTGVDINQTLLEAAREKARERGAVVEYVRSDLREIDRDQEFDAAICFWGSFGYFDEEGDRRFVAAVARSLKPGGRFLIDTMCAESLFPRFQRRGWGRFGDFLSLEERTYDHAAGRVHSDWTLIRDGISETLHSSIRIYTFHELCGIFHDAGFTNCTGFDTHTGEPFRLGSSRLSFVGTKA